MALFEDGQEVNYLENLVGEGKKYKSVEDLAKAYSHADATIQDRNRELAEAREKINARLRVEELLRQPREQNPVTPPVDDNPPSANTSFSEDDLVARIRQELQQDREQEKIRRNVDFVAQKLIETFGSEDKANEVINAKAKELEVSLDFLKSSAAQSPKAFLATLGIADSAPRPTPGVPRSDVVSVPNTAAKPGTYAFYESIRKSNPSQYFSRTIQNQMIADAKRLGDAFYT
jgi:hypothetical protein